VSSLELELRKASDEIAQLREELSAMSNENMQLKVRLYIISCLG
jgi:regulator of replication initiation timing